MLCRRRLGVSLACALPGTCSVCTGLLLLNPCLHSLPFVPFRRNVVKRARRRSCFAGGIGRITGGRAAWPATRPSIRFGISWRAVLGCRPQNRSPDPFPMTVGRKNTSTS
jgi:hypothetical protein